MISTSTYTVITMLWTSYHFLLLKQNENNKKESVTPLLQMGEAITHYIGAKIYFTHL